MNLQETFEFMQCINLGMREDRREEAWAEFQRAGLNVQRLPGVKSQWVRHWPGYQSAPRYACGLSKRLVLRNAQKLNSPAVMLFEDDVVLHPDMKERLSKIELPPDWGMFMLGCQHIKRPEVMAPGLVKVTQAYSSHALGIRAKHYREVRRAIRSCISNAGASDVRIAMLQKIIPTYAVWPNLAWQRESPSSIVSPSRPGGYLPDGSQRWNRQATKGLDTEVENLRTGNATWCRVGNAKVWMHEDEWQAIASRLTSSMRMLEWGSGESTIALARIVNELVSIEHDIAFANELLPKLPPCVRLCTVPPEWGRVKVGEEAKPGQFAGYVRRGTEEGLFDAILVDGRARIECALAALKSGTLKPGGWMFFHDWPFRDRYYRRWPELEPWLEKVEIISHTPRGIAVFKRLA